MSEKSLEERLSLQNFKFCYLYGFTNNPEQSSKDGESFVNLYHNVIGNAGGIMINRSFHPYQLVNDKGHTVWSHAYLLMYLNEKKEQIFSQIIDEKAKLVADLSGIFSQILVWPDTRLTNEENPILAKYVPFVIPFLVHKDEDMLRWDLEVIAEMQVSGNASDYVSRVNEYVRFLMPEPAFLVGFNEFNPEDPSKMIDLILAGAEMLQSN